MFRLLLIAVFLLAIIGFVLYFLWKYVIEPQEQAKLSARKLTTNAVDKANNSYLKIRKEWLRLSLLVDEDAFASEMSNMKIPEVARFQKLIVRMNEKYGDLTEQDDDAPKETFVQQATALKELHDAAAIVAEKNSL